MVNGFVIPSVASAGWAFLSGAAARLPRNIGGILTQVTLEEQHLDRLEITDHPVETGANVSDHAYNLPAQVTIRCGWSNSPTPDISNILQIPADIINGVAATAAAFGGPSSYVQSVYNQLLAMQRSRQLISILTGKRLYNNMEIISLTTTTDRTSENALMVVATCREIILVNTQTVLLDPKVMKDPEANAGVAPRGIVTLGRPTVINPVGTTQ